MAPRIPPPEDRLRRFGRPRHVIDRPKAAYQYRVLVRLARYGRVYSDASRHNGWIEFDPTTHDIPDLGAVLTLLADIELDTHQEVIETYVKRTICFAHRPRRYD